MRTQFVMFVISFALAVVQASAQETKFAPTSVYKKEVIHGFTVLTNPEVLNHQVEAAEVRKELESQLSAILRVVPAKPLAALQKVRIWVEWERRKDKAAEFHYSASWLTDNGYNPEKVDGVELPNTRNFVNWSRADQPWLLLHELSHAYHKLVLNEDHEGIRAAYKQAVERKSYESVDRVNSPKQKAYALTDAREYFAELSEAYFGKNDFYPFTRTDLETHDPIGFQLMGQTWGNP